MSQTRQPFVIVTGMEHSGTTFLANLLKENAPCLNSGFECGILLSEESPRNFHRVKPFYEWLCMPLESGQWGLTSEQREWACDTDSWSEFYLRLSQCSPAIKSGQQILDKTPAYCYALESIMAKAPGCPVFLIHKDPKLLYLSYKKRQVPLDRFIARYRRYVSSVRSALANGSGDIHMVSHKNLCENPSDSIKTILSTLQLELPEQINVRLSSYHLPPLSPTYNYTHEEETANRKLDERETQALFELKEESTFAKGL
ncbi:sulfotransferase [Pelagicoccus sp. SDUM812003]|uniref:sulfotransferase n=1 Tax=Pelagicoccus sp. SDUM812003 TaxID=3041267 RepID=UPI00281070E7|nr:sulfotransferase [Pelagicoccus sp. SDUM812003]MDQ8202510.1 sulfotransferase [Pelagicoccus sp. SDUM812003]